MPHAVRIGLQIRFCLVVDGAGGSLRLEVKGIAPGEVHFNGALAALHRIDSGANEVTVKKNIARHGEQRDIGQPGLQDLRVAAHRVEIELACALRANQRSAGGAHHDIAGHFLEMNIAGDALQGHVAHDLLDINKSGLRAQLQFSFLRHGQLKIGLQLIGRRGIVEHRGDDIDPLVRLLGLNPDFI